MTQAKFYKTCKIFFAVVGASANDTFRLSRHKQQQGQEFSRTILPYHTTLLPLLFA
jgi:hypothetical protein